MGCGPQIIATPVRMNVEPIKVWAFYDAPEHLRALSQHGGDEDWLVLVPADVHASWNCGEPYWITKLDTCDEPSKQVLENGDVVYIGAHS